MSRRHLRSKCESTVTHKTYYMLIFVLHIKLQMAAKIFLRCFPGSLQPWTVAATSWQNSVLKPHLTLTRCLTVCDTLCRKEPTNGNLSDEPDGDSPVKQIRKRRPVIESDSEEEEIRYVWWNSIIIHVSGFFFGLWDGICFKHYFWCVLGLLYT